MNWKPTTRLFTAIAMKREILTAAANPNGATRNIAGICNSNRNVFGMMPHPERACSEALGNTDGRLVIKALLMQRFRNWCKFYIIFSRCDTQFRGINPFLYKLIDYETFVLLYSLLYCWSAILAQSSKQVQWTYSAKKMADKTYEVHMTCRLSATTITCMRRMLAWRARSHYF